MTLPDFAIDRTGVTVVRWAAFLNDVGGEVHHHPLQPLAWVDDVFVPEQGEAGRPIRFVSWYDAQTYCAWAGMRLPTEAEWELAAKGDEGPRRCPWGDEGPACDRAVFFTGTIACEPRPAVVASRSPLGDSPLDLADMAGNVAEWVEDLYGRYDMEEQDDPRHRESGRRRVVRGGGFRESSESISTTTRWGADGTAGSEGIGFRCAVRP